jgi:hypothetical protein
MYIELRRRRETLEPPRLAEEGRERCRDEALRSGNRTRVDTESGDGTTAGNNWTHGAPPTARERYRHNTTTVDGVPASRGDVFPELRI